MSMQERAGRRTIMAPGDLGWGARFAQAAASGRGRSSARQFRFSLGLVLGLAASSGCLLEPLSLGPGDEFSDDQSDSSGESSSAESSSAESSTSEADTGESDTGESDTGDHTCDPQGPTPEGACETLLGYYWDGVSCQPLSGCSCGGACPPIHATPVECWLAYSSCGPSPCAGTDEPSCLASEICLPRYARPLGLDPNTDGICLSDPIYAGCGLATGCDDGLGYGCPEQDPAAAHQFSDSCLPEAGWIVCDPPQAEPIPDCP